MVFRPDVVHDRPHKPREVIRHLEELRAEPIDGFVASFRLQWLAERDYAAEIEAFLASR